MFKKFMNELRKSKDLRNVVAAAVVCLTICFSVCCVLCYAEAATNKINDYCDTVIENCLDEMSNI